MNPNSENSPEKSQEAPAESERDTIGESIDAIHSFYARENQKISRSQHTLERFSDFFGRPVFLGVILLFVVLWILANIVLPRFGVAEFDRPPFSLLQGILTLGALLTTTAVLIKQNRVAKLESQREHLDLKVALLTEQKVAKLIDLLEELRRDLPGVRARHDPEAAALQQPVDSDMVLSTLDEKSSAPAADHATTR